MKYTTLFVMMVFLGKFVVGQNVPLDQLKTQIIVDKDFADTLTFDSGWDYPWYIVHDKSGHFENTLGNSISQSDTVHLFHSANCTTNHQGEHQIRYCVASMLHDTLRLVFMPELPAYASSMTIWINKNVFWSNFQAVYPMKIIGEKLSWNIVKQKLIINDSNYENGDLVKGYVEIAFTETNISLNEKPISQDFYFKGYFKTQLRINE
jgi:hypothetical protein